MQILVVEDDHAIAESIVAALVAAGHGAQCVGSGGAALAADGYDLMILDIGLPDIDGFDVCRRVRAVSQIPIIMLTARNDEIDRVIGLESGADDYLAKPFSLRELLARIKAVTRRGVVQSSQTTFKCGLVVLDTASRRVTLGGSEIILTAKEFDLLEYLVRDPGRVHRRQEIMESVWDMNWYGPTKTLDVHIASLRRKLGSPDWIESVRGVGFRFVEQK